MRNSVRLFKIASVCGLTLVSLCSVAQALTYQQIVQGQTGQVLGASTPGFVNAQNGSTYFNGSGGLLSASALGVTAGNTLVVSCSGATTGDTVSVTDTAGNVFTQSTSVIATNRGVFQFYTTNVVGNASDAITCHYTSSNGYVE